MKKGDRKVDINTCMIEYRLFEAIIEMLENNTSFDAKYCYFIIGTNETNLDDALDYGEVVVENAEVAYVLF